MADKNKTPAYVDKAIKWLERRSPEGERLAFINAKEEQLLTDAGGSGEDAVGGIPSYQVPTHIQERQAAQQRRRAVADAAGPPPPGAPPDVTKTFTPPPPGSPSGMQIQGWAYNPDGSVAFGTPPPGTQPPPPAAAPAPVAPPFVSQTVTPGVGGVFHTLPGGGLGRGPAPPPPTEDEIFLRQLRQAAQQAQQQGATPSPFTGGAGALSGAEALGAFPSPVPTRPTTPPLEVPTLTAGTPELIQQEGLQVGEQPDILPTALVPETGVAQPSPTRVPATVTEAARVADTGAAAAATQVAPTQVIGDIQEAIPTEELAQAATADLDERATVEFQLERVTSAIRDGEPLPPWAAPAARNVDSVMLQRGLGASSMAASARTQALIEAGLPIASADAEAYGRIQLQNLNNRQTTALQNASTLAAMRTQNLNARMTAAVNNASNFLAIDTANLTNEQASNTLTYNAFTQGLFTDQAAENAARQFNATTENQVEQFFTTLETSVEEANANRLTAVRQFNAGEVNAHEQFYENQRLARETFNSNMEASVRAANATWQRSVSTINNANQLMANTFASQTALGLSEREYQFLWQRHRDDAHYIYSSTEAGLDRESQTAALAQQASIARGNQNASRSSSVFNAVGTVVGAFLQSEL
jgi:hypothetical protein